MGQVFETACKAYHTPTWWCDMSPLSSPMHHVKGGGVVCLMSSSSPAQQQRGGGGGGGGAGGGGGGMGRGRGRRDNDLIGQTVRISQGPYKGERHKTRINPLMNLPHRPKSQSSSMLGLSFPVCIVSNAVPRFPTVH